MKVLSKFLKEIKVTKRKFEIFLKGPSAKKFKKNLAIFFSQKCAKGENFIHPFKILLKKPAK